MSRTTPELLTSEAAPLAVTIHSDVICPWCYIGKRRFEAALSAPGLPAEITIDWRPFELNPDMPEEGMDRAEYRARKFGAGRAFELDEEMSERGREEGIVFAFDQMKRTPNTRLAHRLIWAAGQVGRTAQNAIVNRLFEAYFEEARDIGQNAVLEAVAAEAGLDPRIARGALGQDDSLEAVLDLEDAGIRMGIRGVPFFVLANKFAISGAQPAEVWRDALPKIVAEARKAAAH